MNSFIETLNQWSGNFLDFAWSMLWQSSLLIAMLFVFDLLFRRKVRASIRYALWLVVLLKLCVPPTLALPTSPAWWLHQAPPSVVAKPAPHYTVTYDHSPLPETQSTPLPDFGPSKPELTKAAWLLAGTASVGLALLSWLLVRWWQITRQVRRANPSGRLAALAEEAQAIAGIRQKVPVRFTTNSMSPAVCGLFRPAILIPQSLVDHFSDEQLRAVLLHELIHLRRRDVWVNFAQALLQIVYWWHPLVWLANARIRRVREEAVDDAVMLALRDEAESYAPTLLEVAKLALNRPLASLGLVGIMESRHALRQRIERLVDFRPTRRAGLTLVSALGILAFTAVAVPMGEGPAPAEKPPGISLASAKNQTLTVKVNPEIFMRNVKAQAPKTLLPPDSDYTDILLDLLRSEGVDSQPPHGLSFNTATGEITTENTPEQLEIFRQVIEQLNRTDGNCELPLRNNFHRKSVLIEARIYQVPGDEFKNVVSGLQFYPSRQGSDDWWSVSPDKFKQFIGGLESSGLKLIQRPRILTGSGMPALFYVGDGTNSVEFDCKPFAADGFVDLTLQGTVISGPLANPITNYFRNQASAEDHGGMVVRVENFNGVAGSNLLVAIKMEIVTNEPSVKAGSLGQPDLTNLTHSNAINVTGILSDTNFRAAVKALEERNGTNVMPEPEVVTTSGHAVNRIRTDNISAPLSQADVSHLVQDAKLDYEMGRLNEAEADLKAALALDSENAAAKYYLELVRSALSPLNWGRLTPEHQDIAKKLNRIRIPKVSFDHLSLGEVVRQLSETSGENDPEKLGVNIYTITNSVSKQLADVNSVVINLPLLANASLGNILDAVVLSAKKPVQYSILNDGVTFSLQDTNQLYTRHFRVDANEFIAAMQKVPDIKTNSVPAMARDYFKKLGVDLDLPGKSLFYKDRLGELFVRATAQDLDTIENAVEEFNRGAPQIHIKARFIEVPKGTLAGLKSVIAVTNPPVQPNQPSGLVGILTDEHFRTVWHNLEALPGAETLAEPEVVTTSGRQTQMRSTVIQTIVTNFAFQETSTNSFIHPQSGSIETGPVLDVIPYVLSDGYTINLLITPSLVEFLGYDRSTNTTTVYDRAGEKIDVPQIIPKFNVRQMTTTLNLWDNQTAIFSGLPEKDYVNGKEVSGKSKSSDKDLLVFITATIVDPAGNRVHSDKDLPFAKDGIPPQPHLAK